MAVNSGSSSFKFKLFSLPDEKVVARGMADRVGLAESTFTIVLANGESHQKQIAIPDQEAAVNLLINALKKYHAVEKLHEIVGVGHRVVNGGEYFKDSAVINKDNLQKIWDLAGFAPLHNPAEAKGIEAFMHVLPDVPQVAVFDTSFHQTLDPVHYLHSIPYDYYKKYVARKYGAHGTSHRYVSARAAAMLGKDLKDLKLITLHLGAGASITAIKDGKSFDTSMGFSPLAGVTMATRAGDVDPSLVYYIQEREGLTNDEMLNVLNKKSGLLGISTISSDMRDLLDVQDTNEHAKLAINIFINRVIKYVGQYVAEMNGVDAIVFTAGIGENSVPVRKMIVDKLSYFGVKLDDEKNNVRGEEVEISTSDSKVKALLIPTNEELMIARDVESLKA